MNHINSYDNKKTLYNNNPKKIYFEKQLNIKLLEEVNEFLASGETMELVDIYQVILAILEERGISVSAFERLQQQKADLNGEFKRRLFLHFVE